MDRITFPSLQSARDESLAPVKYAVNVSNIGSVDADDVVLGFLKPPGAGVGGVPLQTLFAFERVHVKAGQTVTVQLYPSLLDFTVVNSHGEREVLAGEYAVSFGVEATQEHGQGFATHTLVAN